MQRADYDEENIELCVQHIFGTPQGKLILEWLEDLYLRYPVKGLIDGGVNNLSERLAFDAGCKHVVVNLRNVYENGFAKPKDGPTEEEF